jgi:hypothetical protein
VKNGNLSILPKVHAATPETLIVSNGFSRREEIEELVGRDTLRLAEVLAKSFLAAI